MASGPEAALDLLDPLLDDPLMKTYHLLPSVRGDLLARLGRHAEARAEFERAALLTRNAREQTLLAERARESEQKAREAAESGLSSLLLITESCRSMEILRGSDVLGSAIAGISTRRSQHALLQKMISQRSVKTG